MTQPLLSQLPLSLSHCGFKTVLCSDGLSISDCLFNAQEIELSNTCLTPK